MQASHDAVHPEPLFIPIVGGREEGPVAVRGNGTPPPPRRAVRRYRETNPFRLLGRHHQPVGVAVPTDGEEPLVARRGQHPVQAQLEDVVRNGAVGQRQLLGYGGQPTHLAGSDRYSGHQVGAFRLNVEAVGTQHVVVADAVETAEAGGVVHQVTHRLRRVVSSSPAVLRRRR